MVHPHRPVPRNQAGLCLCGAGAVRDPPGLLAHDGTYRFPSRLPNAPQQRTCSKTSSARAHHETHQPSLRYALCGRGPQLNRDVFTVFFKLKNKVCVPLSPTRKTAVGACLSLPRDRAGGKNTRTRTTTVKTVKKQRSRSLRTVVEPEKPKVARLFAFTQTE